MIKQGLSIVAVVALSACSTSSLGSILGGPLAAPSDDGTTSAGDGASGDSGGGTGASTDAGTGGTTSGGPIGNGVTTGSVFPVGDASSYVRSRGSATYVASSASTPVSIVRSNNAPSELATYDLTINGVTYNLAPKDTNRPGLSTNSFVASVGGAEVSMFLNEGALNAGIASTKIVSGNSIDSYVSIVGTPTDSTNLPAMATYSGNGEISLDTGAIDYDDAPDTTVTLNADFASGTLNGQFNVSDAAGDGTGLVDIAGSAVLPVTGTIQGSTFSADVDYKNLVGITSGLGFVKPGAITGGFYGPNADEAVGVGVTLGRSAQPNDVMVYTRIQASKQ